MRRTLITLLAVITLLSQLSWLEHGYAEHSSGDVCEVCVSASGHVAVIPSVPQLPPVHGSDFPLAVITPSQRHTTQRFYATRAPPRFL